VARRRDNRAAEKVRERLVVALREADGLVVGDEEADSTSVPALGGVEHCEVKVVNKHRQWEQRQKLDQLGNFARLDCVSETAMPLSIH
jgi:hypothetical protein